MSKKLSEIAAYLSQFGAQAYIQNDCSINGLAALQTASSDEITFLSDRKRQNELSACAAACVIVAPWAEDAARARGNCIVMPDAYVGYAHVSQWWKKQHTPALDYRIHASAQIHPQAVIADDAIIGPLCTVERGARIGAGTWLKSNVVVGADCVIGARCIIHPGAVIGADGFGFAKEGDTWRKIEQLGAVRIGDDVEIGANTCVDRGALSDTIIEDGVKLDNLIQIAHNVHLGKNVAMAACAGIAGSTTVAEGCTIGGAANIMGHITLGKGVHISATTFASRSLHQPGQYTGYFPIDKHADFLENGATTKQLYKMRQRIQLLEQQLAKITNSK